MDAALESVSLFCQILQVQWECDAALSNLSPRLDSTGYSNVFLVSGCSRDTCQDGPASFYKKKEKTLTVLDRIVLLFAPNKKIKLDSK
jgi:hypothetical protein